MRVAVVARSARDAWSEADVAARRLAGALACFASVDLLTVAAAASSGPRPEGAFRAWSFAEYAPADERRARHLFRALVDGRDELPPAAHAALVDEWMRARGGGSGPLLDHLATERYDIVAFVDAAAATTRWGVEAVADETRVMLAPACVRPDVLGWSPVRAVLDRADSVVAASAAEREAVLASGASIDASRVHLVGSVARVNDLARGTRPVHLPPEPAVVIVRDWRRPFPLARLWRWATALREEVGRAGGRPFALRVVGPGASFAPDGLGTTTDWSLMDAWRWMANAAIVIDPEPDQFFAPRTLEAMAFGVPVLAAADGGASRSHLDRGDGGLWYRTYHHLRRELEALLDDPEMRARLGSQGRRYARSEYGDLDGYLDRVKSATFGS